MGSELSDLIGPELQHEHFIIRRIENQYSCALRRKNELIRHYMSCLIWKESCENVVLTSCGGIGSILGFLF